MIKIAHIFKPWQGEYELFTYSDDAGPFATVAVCDRCAEKEPDLSVKVPVVSNVKRCHCCGEIVA